MSYIDAYEFEELMEKAKKYDELNKQISSEDVCNVLEEELQDRARYEKHQGFKVGLQLAIEEHGDYIEINMLLSKRALHYLSRFYKYEDELEEELK